MSQIFREDASLQDIVSAAEVIVEAEKLSEEQKEIKYDDIPPFGYTAEKYKVLEVLKNTTGKEIPDEIEVAPSSLSVMADVHESYEREGISTSPLLATYQKGRREEPKRAILFLTPSDFEDFEFVCAFSWEETKEREKIKKLIEKSKQEQ